MNPQENATELLNAMDAVKAHPMCASFEIFDGFFRVTYPCGMYPNGIQAHFNKNQSKTKALQLILAKMEKHWKSNRILGSNKT